LLASVAATGCYYYQPVARDAVRPGAQLALALTDSGTSHFWPFLGPDVGVVRGRLLGTDPRAFTVSVTSITQRHGQDLFWKGEQVQLPQEFVAYLQERRLSKVRTAIAAGGSVLAFVSFIIAFDLTGIGGGSVGGGGGGRR
jgi:hypothetical protein